MAFRSELPYLYIIARFKDFDHGEIVSKLVPVDWNLEPGDRLEYEAGSNCNGIAEVVSVAGETTHLGEKEMVECTFKKI